MFCLKIYKSYAWADNNYSLCKKTIQSNANDKKRVHKKQNKSAEKAVFVGKKPAETAFCNLPSKKG